jgi:hypothetical protein
MCRTCSGEVMCKDLSFGSTVMSTKSWVVTCPPEITLISMWLRSFKSSALRRAGGGLLMELTVAAMRKLLDEIADHRSRTYRLIGFDDQSLPGPPASEDDLRLVEESFGVALPPTYRLFLSIHNGWEHWSGDVALLSTKQMLAGEYAERVGKWKRKQSPVIRNWLESTLIVGFSLFAGEQILVDLTLPQKGAVIIWEHKEVERFQDFHGYLVDFLGTLKEELASDLQG